MRIGINEIEKYAKTLINYRVVCKCGHSQVIPPQLDRTVCDWCGKFIFKDEKTEFKYRVKEAIRKRG